MASWIVAHIFERMQITQGECAVLTAIAQVTDVRGHNGVIAYDALAQRTGFSQRWVVQLVQRLEAKHLLRVRRQRYDALRYYPNCYTIVRPWLVILNGNRDRARLRDHGPKQAKNVRSSERSLQRGENTTLQQRLAAPIHRTNQDNRPHHPILLPPSPPPDPAQLPGLRSILAVLTPGSTAYTSVATLIQQLEEEKKRSNGAQEKSHKGSIAARRHVNQRVFPLRHNCPA